MTRPKIKIPKDQIDKLVEILGIAVLFFTIVFPVISYNQLPDSIPRHFDINGQPDAYGSKWLIFILPLIGIVLYTGLTILNRYPHIFNYPTKVTEENAERLYKNATKLVRILNTLTISIFAYITYVTIQTGLGKQSGLGNYFFIAFLILFSVPIGFFIIKSMKSK